MTQLKTPRVIAGEWADHNDSKLKEFSERGWFVSDALQYLKEVEILLQPEYHTINNTLSVKDERELNILKKHLLSQCKSASIYITYKSHPTYGYNVPCILAAPDAIVDSIKPITYPV